MFRTGRVELRKLDLDGLIVALLCPAQNKTKRTPPLLSKAILLPFCPEPVLTNHDGFSFQKIFWTKISGRRKTESGKRPVRFRTNASQPASPSCAVPSARHSPSVATSQDSRTLQKNGRCLFWRAVLKAIICQDRLGTNASKSEMVQKGACFRRTGRWVAGADLVRLRRWGVWVPANATASRFSLVEVTKVDHVSGLVEQGSASVETVSEPMGVLPSAAEYSGRTAEVNSVPDAEREGKERKAEPSSTAPSSPSLSSSSSSSPPSASSADCAPRFETCGEKPRARPDFESACAKARRRPDRAGQPSGKRNGSCRSRFDLRPRRFDLRPQLAVRGG